MCNIYNIYIYISSSYWPVYKFFASQSQHKYKIIIFFFGEANDEANFSFFILLQERAKPILTFIFYYIVNNKLYSMSAVCP